MDQINHTGLISGFNDLKQLEMSVKAAQKMVGSATMSLDPEALQNAEKAVADAQEQFNSSLQSQTGVDQQFLSTQQELLSQCEHQLSEAKQ